MASTHLTQSYSLPFLFLSIQVAVVLRYFQFRSTFFISLPFLFPFATHVFSFLFLFGPFFSISFLPLEFSCIFLIARCVKRADTHRGLVHGEAPGCSNSNSGYCPSGSPAAPITKGRHRPANQFDRRSPRAPAAPTRSWCPSPSASASLPRRPSARGTAEPAPPPPVRQNPRLLNPSTAAPAGNTAPPIVAESLTRVTHICPTSTTVAARDFPGHAAAIWRQTAACVGGEWGPHVPLWVGLWSVWSVCVWEWFLRPPSGLPSGGVPSPGGTGHEAGPPARGPPLGVVQHREGHPPGGPEAAGPPVRWLPGATIIPCGNFSRSTTGIGESG